MRAYLIMVVTVIMVIIIVIMVVNQAGVPTEYPLFALAEAIYMSWFTFELLIRLVS